MTRKVPVIRDFRLIWISLLVTAALLEAAQSPLTSSNGVRVALMVFSTDDNSYRSSLAAVDLASLLQAELSNDTPFQWVERDDLKSAESELELSELGIQDTVGAIRRGRYVAADWIVTGSFGVKSNEAWGLVLEVIDVAHADLLATRKAEFSRAAHPTLKSVLSQSAVIAREVRAALGAAKQRWEAIRNRRTVALLMLLDAEMVEADMAREVESMTDGTKGWRVIRIDRAKPSFTEAEMLLLGLVEHDGNTWDKLADAYVWGRLAVRHPVASNKIPSSDYEPVLEITVWKGEGDEQTSAVSGRRGRAPAEALAQLPELARSAATNLFHALNVRGQGKERAGTRAHIAQSLFERAKTWRWDRDHGFRWRAEKALWMRDEFGTLRRTDDLLVRNEISQQLRMLETACFFDPQNQGAYELLLRLHSRSGWQFSSNRFRLLMKQAEGWGNYFERFGLSSTQIGNTGVEMDTAPVPATYVTSALGLVDVSSLGNKEERGFPRDMSGQVARKWLAEFTTELVKRVLRTVEEPVTKEFAHRILLDGLTGSPKPLMMVEGRLRRQAIEALWPAFLAQVPAGSRRQDHQELCESVSATYAELGLAGQEKGMLDMLEKPSVTKSPAPIRLPRSSQLDRIP